MSETYGMTERRNGAAFRWDVRFFQMSETSGGTSEDSALARPAGRSYTVDVGTPCPALSRPRSPAGVLLCGFSRRSSVTTTEGPASSMRGLVVTFPASREAPWRNGRRSRPPALIPRGVSSPGGFGTCSVSVAASAGQSSRAGPPESSCTRCTRCTRCTGQPMEPRTDAGFESVHTSCNRVRQGP